MKNMIETKNLTKTYKAFTAVDHVSLHIKKGSIYGFLGPNGAGKSTTMKIIMSLVKETQGQLELFESTDNQVNRGRIGAIIEQPAFYPYMTAYENLQYYIKFKGIVEANSIENASSKICAHSFG